MEIYENIGKSESYPAYQKPVINPLVFYNNYFDEPINIKLQGAK